jgi:hypothetical protein
MLSEHPVAAVAMIGVAGVGAGVWLIDRERDRHAEPAARAERENAELLRLMARPTFGNPFRAPTGAVINPPQPHAGVRLQRTEPMASHRELVGD